MASKIELYWISIANKLKQEHPENKPPSEWSNKEFESILKREQKEIGVSYSTFRRIFKEKDTGNENTRDSFAQYLSLIHI